MNWRQETDSSDKLIYSALDVKSCVALQSITLLSFYPLTYFMKTNNFVTLCFDYQDRKGRLVHLPKKLSEEITQSKQPKPQPPPQPPSVALPTSFIPPYTHLLELAPSIRPNHVPTSVGPTSASPAMGSTSSIEAISFSPSALQPNNSPALDFYVMQQPQMSTLSPRRDEFNEAVDVTSGVAADALAGLTDRMEAESKEYLILSASTVAVAAPAAVVITPLASPLSSDASSSNHGEVQGKAIPFWDRGPDQFLDDLIGGLSQKIDKAGGEFLKHIGQFAGSGLTAPPPTSAPTMVQTALSTQPRHAHGVCISFTRKCMFRHGRIDTQARA